MKNRAVRAPIGPGTRLGSYELQARIGVGGMGEVYRAADTRLHRVVAIKLVRPDVVSATEWQSWFEQEATALSNTNHPHICRLYDIGRWEGVDFLVMEYLEGQLLSDRLKGGPLPLSDVLRYGAQIAGALEHAHLQGIVHRDVKPSNIMLTAVGAKLLDFGIASRPDTRIGGGGNDPESPTPVIPDAWLGTVQHMAPERLEGYDADPRSDIFALGTVLYEMATGEKPFSGSSPAAIAAAILTKDPEPLSLRDPTHSPRLDHVVRRCLAKKPDERWRNAGDVKIELEWIQEGLLFRAPTESKNWLKSASARAVLLSALLLAALAVVGLLSRRSVDATPEAGPLTRFEIPAMPGNADGQFALDLALSPDAKHIVFSSNADLGRRRLVLRSLSSPLTQELAGTEDAHDPFWSPDSRQIAFFARGELRAFDLQTNTSRKITATPTGQAPAGTWAGQDTIVVGSGSTGLYRIAAGTGNVTVLSSLNAAEGEIGQMSPRFLPDGQHFTYRLYGNPSKNGLYLASLDAPMSRVRLLDAASKAEYADPGFLVFVRNRRLVAHPFDVRGLRLRGDPIELGISVTQANTGEVAFSVTSHGALAYQVAAMPELTWFDRKGTRLESIPGTVEPSEAPVMSPDGSQVAFARRDQKTGETSIWIQDLSSLSSTRAIESGGATLVSPVWSPDGKRIAYSSNKGGRFDLHVRSLDDQRDEILFRSSSDKWPVDWSRDGTFLLFRSDESDLFALALRDRRPIKINNVAPFRAFGQMSPDGRFVAYVSRRLGMRHVFVRSFPAGDMDLQVTTDGGVQPSWSPNGKELFFLTPDGTLASVPVSWDKGSRTIGSPIPLFRTTLEGLSGIGLSNQYSVDRTGARFLINEPRVPPSATPITVAVNWVPKAS